MKTLYDMLGALPDDDAESLRTAFRKAVKAAHPDSNTGDPDASLRFRQIVRANAILSDAEQRATYDRLLALALRQHKSKRAMRSGTIRKFASDAIAVTFLSVVSIGGYILFEQLSKAPDVPLKMAELAARAPADFAAVAPKAQPGTSAQAEPRDRLGSAGVPEATAVPSAVAPAAAAGNAQGVASTAPAPDLATTDTKSDARDELRDKFESLGLAAEAVAPPPNAGSAQAVANADPASNLPATDAKPDARDEPCDRLESAGVAAEAIAPSAVAPPPNAGSAQAFANAAPAPDLPATDAKSYRERGIFAYRDGDLSRAIAAFDLAIQHDPQFADAYIDRGIVFYRLGEFDRAFADIARAKRIENANRAKTSPPTLHKDERSSRSSRLREVRS
jgi:curved DNA-binding protein CbpA